MQIFSIYYFFDFILTDWIIFYIIIYVVWAYTLLSGCGSVWLERHLREVEAASSNLVTPIYLCIYSPPKGLTTSSAGG